MKILKEISNDIDQTSNMIRRLKHAQEDNIKRIVIFRFEHIGDYSISLPALRAIREKYPEAKIDLVVGPWNKDLANATSYIDNVIVFDNPLTKRHIGYKGLLKAALLEGDLRKFISKINKNKYDLLISFSDRKYNKVFLKFFKTKNKICGDKFPNTGIDDRQRILNLMKKYDICNTFKRVTLNITKEDKKVVDNLIGKNKIIAIHPFTPLSEKNWIHSNWIEVIEGLLKEDKSLKFFLIGSKKDKASLDWIRINKLKDKVINGADKLSLVQLVYLIEKSELIIGCDSGPVHLAELTDTPIISLFGPTSEVMWGVPKGKGITIKKDSIDDIKYEEVIEEALRRI